MQKLFISLFILLSTLKPWISAKAEISEQKLDELIELVFTQFHQEVESVGGELVINKQWENLNKTEKALRNGNKFIIEVHGGLARHPHITSDGFLLILCHELGHHIGGPPFFSENHLKVLSNEGQADYYATSVCLKQIFQNNHKLINKKDHYFHNQCKNSFSRKKEINICERILHASLNAAFVLGHVAAETVSKPFIAPQKNLKEKRQVAQTRDKHSNPQCRLETFINGALNRPRPSCWYTETFLEKELLKALMDQNKDQLSHYLSLGANPNTVNLAGLSLLSLAIKLKNSSMVELLLEKEADLLLTDDHLESAYHFAARSEDLKITQLLSKTSQSKKMINYQNIFGQTALHLAAKNGNFPIVQLLIESGADPALINAKGLTAKEIAEENHYQRIFSYLDDLESGQDNYQLVEKLKLNQSKILRDPLENASLTSLVPISEIFSKYRDKKGGCLEE